MTLDESKITSKCVEISKSLLNTSPGFVGYDLGVSRCIGDVARVAVSIRQAGEISREKFAGISTALKIDFRLAESDILSKLEELSWIELRKQGKKIVRVDEQIPPTEDILSTLGGLWEEMIPSQIDEMTINGLNKLSIKPYTTEALTSELELSEQEFKLGYEYGEQANYFGKFHSLETGEEVIWTPLYWAGKLDSVRRYLERQHQPEYDAIGTFTDQFLKFPGVPREKMGAGTNINLLDAGIAHGYFPSVGVQDRKQNNYEYLFAASPQFEIDPSKDLFEKARMIVSCIRHGQFHAEISKIRYPQAILRTMREGTLSPHSYANVQYLLLKCHGIVDLQKVGRRTKVIWLDTPENNLAADIANQLLAGEEIIARSKEDLEIQKILIQGTFNYSSEQRRIKTTHRIVSIREYDRLMESLVGVRE